MVNTIHLGIYQPVIWEEGSSNEINPSTVNASTTNRLSGGELRRSGGDNNSAINNISNSGVGGSSIVAGGSTSVNPMYSSEIHHPHASPTPPLQRRLAKSFSVAPSSHSQSKGLVFIRQF